MAGRNVFLGFFILKLGVYGEIFSNFIVDLIYEFYESKGCMSEDIDDDTEIEIDEDELTAFVVKNAKRDGVGKFTPEEITFIVQGEMAYCESLDMFE